MAELSLENGQIVVDFAEESKRDVIFASSVARHTAFSLERLAGIAIGSGFVCMSTGPSIDVRCILHNGKPLVQWVLGRWVTQLLLSPAHALRLAAQTREAAGEAERVAKWTEYKEPAALLN